MALPAGASARTPRADATTTTEEIDMYDMYPDWGPAKHRTEQHESTGSSDSRDALEQRPDDN